MRGGEQAQSTDTGLSRLCLAGYFFVGSVAVLLPSLLPLAIREFGLTLAEAGRIFPVTALGSLVGGLLAGVCSDRIGRKPFIVGSALSVAAALIIASFSRSWLSFVGSFLLVGLAQGALGIGINALVMDLGARRHGKAINTLHGMYGLGATLSPFLIGWLLHTAPGWRVVLTGAALIWLLFSGASAGFRYPPAVGASARRTPTFRWRLGEHSVLLPLLALAFFYNGVAVSLLGWVKVYVQQQGVRSDILSSSMISLFYAALTIGRFACAQLAERLGYGQILLLCALGATCFYPLVAFNHHPFGIATGVFGSGLFLSGLYPTAIAYGTRRFPDLSGTIAGSMSAALTIGSMLPPWWTGVVAGARGLPFAIGLNYAYVVPLVGIALYLRQRESH